MTKSFAFRIFHLIKGYDWHADTWQTKSLSDLKWGRRIFSIGCGSLVREEFLKQPVGNSNIYLWPQIRKCNVWRIQCHDCSNTWNLNQMGNVKIFHSTNLRWQKSTAFFGKKIIIHAKLVTTITFQLNRPKDIIRRFSHETFVVITTNIKIQ